MLDEKVPHVDSSEGARLLADARRLFWRAASFAARTSSIKVWVPLTCSCVLTVYYLYTMHRNPATLADVQPAAAGTPDKVVPDVSPAQQAHAGQGFDEARLWREFMDHSPTPQQVCPAIGRAYERSGEIDKAIAAYEKCSSIEPGNVDTLIALAHALQGKSQFSRAAGLYRLCLAKDPKNMDARTGLAFIALKQNRLRDASDGAGAVLRENPGNPDALLIAGIVAWHEHRLEDAERFFLRGIALDDQRTDFHAFLGRIAEAQGRPEQALQQYDEVLALDPNNAEIAQRRDRLQPVR